VKRFVVLCLLCAGLAPGGFAEGIPWHHPLYLGNGEFWRQRIPLVISNDLPRAAVGEPVTLRVGEELNLVGARAEAVRVCDAGGTEMLFALTTAEGKAITRGPIPPGATLTIPVECPANGKTTYYVYFDNPAAWAVPDFLEGTGELRNGGMEEGEGDTPAGWRHDQNDAEHRTFWTSENPHSGARCLKTVVSEGAQPTWIATRQHGLHIIGGARYVMTAWVKAQNVKGNAGWYIHVGNQTNPMIINTVLNGGGGTYDWKQVRTEFVATPDANVADLGTVLWGTGIAWFDDVELQCSEQFRVKVIAGQPERLRVREVGSGAPWRKGGDSDDCRVPVRVVNFSDTTPLIGLISVDLTNAFARLRGRVDRGSLLVESNGRAVRSYQFQDIMLFEGNVSPLTAQTYYVYCRAGDRPLAVEKPSTFAPNPALPGAGTTTRLEPKLIANYEALLNSPFNLVKNASFEQGDDLPTGWPGGAEGERPAGAVMSLDEPGLFGRRCVKTYVPATSRKAWTGWRQRVPVKPNKTYLFAAWLKTNEVTPSVQLHAHFLDEQGKWCKPPTGAGPALSGTKDWTLISGLFKMPKEIATFELHLTMLASGTVWHDGVVLIEVTTEGEPLPLESRRAETITGLTAWPVNAIMKVFREDVPPQNIPPARITCARNEKEPLQLAFRSPQGLTGVRVVADGPQGPGGRRLPPPEIAVVGYVPIDHKSNYYSSDSPAWHRKFPTAPGSSDGWAGWWPDPLLPKDTFDLAANSTQPVWFTFSIPEDAPAGDYSGKVQLKVGGRVVKEVPFTIHVWDFTLPRETHLKAIYDCRQGNEWQLPGMTREESTRQMWRFMAEHRLCPDTIRFGPDLQFKDGQVIADFTEFDKAASYYFDELKLPHAYTPWHFFCFGWGHPPGNKFGEKPYEGEYPFKGVDHSQLRPAFKQAYQACLRTFWEHIKEKGWVDRFTLYISDEPFDSDADIRAQMKALCKMIHEVDPKIPIYCSTWHHQPEWDGYLNVWGIGHYGIVPEEKIRELQRSGATIWWTTDGQMCIDTPYCAIERLLPHYCFKYGAEAYEFWGIDWLTYDPYEFGWHRFIHQSDQPGRSYYVRYPNGDGYLAYPGKPIGHHGPVSSVRLEQAREGVEDYEYFYLLRQRISSARAAGRNVAEAEKALQRASQLVYMPCASGRFSTQILPDPDAVLRVKEEIARAVELLGK